MIVFSVLQDGSGVVTGGGVTLGFAAGITPADVLAMHAAIQPTTPTPLAVTVQAAPVTVNAPPVTVNAPDVTALQATVAALKASVNALPGAVKVP